MPDSVFTAITFSPVTEFIEKTRKLRDLYGSSFILSYLAEAVCRAAQHQLGEDAVVSPALLNTTMGTPDQIVIQGNFPERDAKRAFSTAWGRIMSACREWMVQNCNTWIDQAYSEWVAHGEWSQSQSRALPWRRDWQLWENYAWEVFWAQGATIPEVLDALADAERNRNWVGVNWMGESSTLSGADGIAWPGLGRTVSPKQQRMGDTDTQIRQFFQELNLKIGEAILDDDLSNYRNPISRLQRLADHYNVDAAQRLKPDVPQHQSLRQELAQKLGEAILTEREQLSILEMTKRLFTLRAVAETVPDSDQLQQEVPESFSDVNLWTTDKPMGWFRGDGDQAGQYVRQITQGEDAVAQLHHFSHQMRQWGRSLKQRFDQRLGRIIFAGGDDFLGVFYPSDHPTTALNWLYTFKETIWHRGLDDQPDRKPITPSIGFVWAAPKVPQRDVLQHCELAEHNAKDCGRDRLALRVLFNSGNYLEWVCPWWFLESVLQGYCDRNDKAGDAANWTHLYNDVAMLEARHAFAGNQTVVALALFDVYFGQENRTTLESHFWDNGDRTGILGNREEDCQNIPQALNNWVMNLAKVGFYLCSNT